MLKIYGAVCGIASLLAFILYGIDKLSAKKGKRRVPELTLLTVAALGGGVGALSAMLLFRHKVNFGRKAHFVLAVPACVFLQIALAWMIVCMEVARL